MEGIMRRLKLYLVRLFKQSAVGACALTVLLFPAAAKGKCLIADAAETTVYVGGMTAGFTLPAGGVQIVELSSVPCGEGSRRPAEEAGLRAGDIILAADGISLSAIGDLTAALERSGGREIVLTFSRDGETRKLTVRPAKDKNTGNFKIGVLIRDTLSGIGTITYIEKDGLHFGALGHGVNEGAAPDAPEAKVYACNIIGVKKGTRGKAGELKGLFLNDRPIARAEHFCSTGLFGTFSDGYDFSACETAQIAPVSEATIGKAVIYSTVDGTQPKTYDIAIAKVDANDRDNKNFVIKVTDEALIGETGGIVQGMSGSPILQNGKLIGAVTHVFLNDPTRGYGISIERMMTGERER